MVLWYSCTIIRIVLFCMVIFFFHVRETMCLKLFSFSAASAVFVLYIDRNFIQLELHSLFSWFCSLPWILWIIASIFFANEDALFSVILFYFLFLWNVSFQRFRRFFLQSKNQQLQTTGRYLESSRNKFLRNTSCT